MWRHAPNGEKGNYLMLLRSGQYLPAGFGSSREQLASTKIHLVIATSHVKGTFSYRGRKVSKGLHVETGPFCVC